MTTVHQPTHKQDDGLAIAAMVLGIVSLMGFGFLLGIPAIILAIVALKKRTAYQGMSIAGLVMGIISSLMSLLFIAFVIFLLLLGADSMDSPPQTGDRTDAVLESSRT